MSTFTRKAPSERKAEILSAALSCAEKHGFQSFTREQVAEKAAVSPASVNRYFSTMAHLRTAVMRQAIKTRVLPLVAQGIVAKHPAASRTPTELRREALASLQ